VFKIYFFAAVILFWVTLSASLMRAQLAAASVYKMRMPYRSLLVHSIGVGQTKSVANAISYN